MAIKRTKKPFIVAYLRTSTGKQATRGTSLEAQRELIDTYAREHGVEVIAEYVEVCSGGQRSRPELQRAIDHSVTAGATLLVAKLDRLVRNLGTLEDLREAGVDFAIANCPGANRFTVALLALVGEIELEFIRERTKAGLAVRKRKGVKLGSDREGHWEGREHRRKLGSKRGLPAANRARQEHANAYYRRLLADVVQWHDSGMSLRQIAVKLQANRRQTPTGKTKWSASQVSRILQRRELLTA